MGLALWLALVLLASSTSPQTSPREEGGGEWDAPAVVQWSCSILLELQEGEGRREWPYEGVYRVQEPGSSESVIPIGYRVGGTSIACLALLAAPGYGEPENEERRAAVARGVEFVLQALDLPLMEAKPQKSYDVRGWGFVYALALLVELEKRGAIPEPQADSVGKAIPRLVEALEDTALGKAGGWNYSGRPTPSPFMTAPALQALFAAAEGGHKVSKKVVRASLEALERGRAQSGSVAYTTPKKSRAKTEEDELDFMDQLPGAMGRMLVVESTLTLAGEGDEERLAAAVRSFFTHWDQLEIRRRKNGTHVEPYGVAPYYVMFAHYHAAQAIELLNDPKERAAHRAELWALFERTQEPGGGWNDRVFERSLNYGTALGILALLQPDLPPPARWEE